MLNLQKITVFTTLSMWISPIPTWPYGVVSWTNIKPYPRLKSKHNWVYALTIIICPGLGLIRVQETGSESEAISTSRKCLLLRDGWGERVPCQESTWRTLDRRGPWWSSWGWSLSRCIRPQWWNLRKPGPLSARSRRTSWSPASRGSQRYPFWMWVLHLESNTCSLSYKAIS